MKNKFNFKLLNILVLLLIIAVFVFIWPMVGKYVSIAITALIPLVIAFTIAYILNPVVNFMSKYKIPRVVAIIILFAAIIGFFIYLIFGVIKPALDSIGDITVGIENILIEIGNIFNIDTSGFASYANQIVSDLIAQISNFFTASGGTVNQVFSTLVNGAVVIVVGIIFLVTFPKVRQSIKNFLEPLLKPKNFEFVKTVDKELTNYLWAELLIAGLQALEYGGFMLILSIFFREFLVFVPLVALVAAIFSLIPYFGGYFSIMFTAVIIMTVPNAAYGMIGLGIFTLIFPQLDAYVINPKIYQTKLKLNPIATIAFVLIGQAFFGIMGAILSVPFQVLLEVIMNYYKKDIINGIKGINNII